MNFNINQHNDNNIAYAERIANANKNEEANKNKNPNKLCKPAKAMDWFKNPRNFPDG